MDEQPSEHEQALRKLPLTYSLALRLRDAGVAPEVVCGYVGVEPAFVDGLYRIAEAELSAALDAIREEQNEDPDEGVSATIMAW